MAAKQQLEIPVGAAFEKRLAELVWENCPQLAKETAAGRMAFAIDVSDPGTIEAATDQAVSEAVAQLVGPLTDSARELLDETCSVDKVVKDVKESLRVAHASIQDTLKDRLNAGLEKAVKMYCDTVLVRELQNVAKGMFNERPLARTVREKLEQLISEYLETKLEPEKSGRGALIAAEAEMVTRVAHELGKKG